MRGQRPGAHTVPGCSVHVRQAVAVRERCCLIVTVHAKLSRDRVLCAQEVAHRRPYEVILLARKAPDSSASQEAAGCPAAAAGVSEPAATGPAPPNPRPVPDNLVLLACPQEHSRKPQLGLALAPLLPPRPRCLEVIRSPFFATHLRTLM